MNNEVRTEWPNLNKDTRAVELAKIAMGWDQLSVEQKMERSRELVQKAQDFKESL